MLAISKVEEVRGGRPIIKVEIKVEIKVLDKLAPAVENNFQEEVKLRKAKRREVLSQDSLDKVELQEEC